MPAVCPITARGVLGCVLANVGLLAALGVVDDPALAPPIEDEGLIAVLAPPPLNNWPGVDAVVVSTDNTLA